MRNPYEACFWQQERYSGALAIKTRIRFKNLHSAMKWAEKMNGRHCQETKYVRRRTTYVDIYKNGKCIIELQPVIVPSVGELGWW